MWPHGSDVGHMLEPVHRASLVQHLPWTGPHVLFSVHALAPACTNSTGQSRAYATHGMQDRFGAYAACGACAGSALCAGSGTWGWFIGPIQTGPRSSMQCQSGANIACSKCPRLALCTVCSADQLQPLHAVSSMCCQCQTSPAHWIQHAWMVYGSDHTGCASSNPCIMCCLHQMGSMKSKASACCIQHPSSRPIGSSTDQIWGPYLWYPFHKVFLLTFLIMTYTWQGWI